MSIKEQLYRQCHEHISKRLKLIQNTIEHIQQSLHSETKSTVGDKHETARAMLHIEREKAGQQLAILQKQNETLQKIDINKTSQNITIGSLVYTTGMNYFIALSLGELEVNNHTFYAVSLSTPIGKLLLSKKQGDTIAFRDNVFTITKVC